MEPSSRGKMEPKAASQETTPAMDPLRDNIDAKKNSAKSDEKNDFRSYLLKYKYFVLALVLASAKLLLDGNSCSYSWIYSSSIAVDTSINVQNHTFDSSQCKTIPWNDYLQTNVCDRMGLRGYFDKDFFDAMKKQFVPSWLEELDVKPLVQWWSKVKTRWLSPRTPGPPKRRVDPNIGRGFVIGMLLIPPLLILLQTDLATAICTSAGVSVVALIATRYSPSVTDVLLWVQPDRLLLLAAALSWNAAVCETGLYDVLAVYTAKYKSSMVVYVLWAGAAIGALADHVACTALLTPLIIRVMEEHKLDPRPVVATASALADLSAHLCMRSGTFGRALDDELGETHKPVLWGVLTFIAAAAYFGVAFLLFKPHNYKQDYWIAELQHEHSLWERLKLSMAPCAQAQDTLGDAMDQEMRVLRQDIERLEKGLGDPKPSYHLLSQRRARLRKHRLLFWLCAVVGVFAVYKCLAVEVGRDRIDGVMRRSASWGMLAMMLLAGPRQPLNSLASRIDITTLLTHVAANFYGNVLVVLRFPEVVARFIFPYMVGSPSKVAREWSYAVFWISAVLSACTGSGAARPLAAMVRKLRVHSRAIAHAGPLMTSVASAATLGHAIGSAAFVVSSPGAQAAATSGAQQGYRLSAGAHARLMLPLVALLLAAAHCCHLKYNLFV